ncbi:MAG: hypothetical protein MHM6MM_004147 [Cercozoa sp. M6MM]
MAEQIQKLIEDTLPYLEDLIDNGLFTTEEVRQITLERKKHEYALKRVDVPVQMFLRYIEYEQTLEALRKLRKKRQHVQRPLMSDRMCQRQVTLIFERLVAKHSGQPRLWLMYSDFLVQRKARSKASQVLARALALHPRDPELWIRSAAHEFDHEGRVSAARKLLMRALRISPTEPLLWKALLQLELAFAQKLRLRRVVLQGDDDGDDEIDDAAKDELIVSAQEDSAEPAPKKRKVVDTKQQLLERGVVALSVFKKAALDLSDSDQKAKLHVELLKLVPEDSNFDGLRKAMWKHVLETYPRHPVVVVARAHDLAQRHGSAAALAVFDDLVPLIDSLARFVRERLDLLEQSGHSEGTDNEEAAFLLQVAIKALTAVSQQQTLKLETVGAFASFLQITGQAEEARDVLRRALAALTDTSSDTAVGLVLQLVSMLRSESPVDVEVDVNCTDLNNDSDDEALRELRRRTRGVRGPAAVRLFHALLQIILSQLLRVTRRLHLAQDAKVQKRLRKCRTRLEQRVLALMREVALREDTALHCGDFKVCPKNLVKITHTQNDRARKGLKGLYIWRV